MTIPNVFNIADAAAFSSECEKVSTDLTARGLECTPAHVAQGVRLGSLIGYAAIVRGSSPSKHVKALADNIGACVSLALAIEALGVVDPTDEQIGAFVSLFEAALAGATGKPKARAFR